MREIVREANRNGREYDRGNYAGRSCNERRETEKTYRVETEVCRPERAKAGRKLRISALDIILVSIAAVLLVGIVILAFDLDVRELPKSVSVIWWVLVSIAGACVASLGM